MYGGLVGLLHLGTLEACSAAQISYISHVLLQQNPPTNETASSMFGTDVLYFPMVYGIWGLIYGVLYGVVFSVIYFKLPGSTSRKKGMVLGIPVFFIGVFAGPAYVLYQCSPSFLPTISLGLGLPISFLYGYFLGLFYDSFGRLALEQKENIKLGNTDRSKLLIIFNAPWIAQYRTTVWLLQRELGADGLKWKLFRSLDSSRPP